MSNHNPTNLAHSVEAKLKNIVAARHIDYRFILIRYATEHFLYRLSVSPHAKQFVLKGGNLFIIWQKGYDYRPTVDSDLLCFGNATPEHLHDIFAQACVSTEVPEDGMVFDPKTIEISPIREDTEYGGTRILLVSYLGRARTTLQFDIGIGDAITPAPETVEYPALLGGPAPVLQAYPMATAIAEKTEAMVSRGLINSRMKDFHDIWLLSELFEHDYQTLVLAVNKTFERRRVAMPKTIPIALTAAFGTDSTKQIQWKAFIRKTSSVKAPADFSLVISRIAEFLIPVLFSSNTSFICWLPDKGWE